MDMPSVDVDSLKRSIHRLEFSHGGKALLNDFFTELEEVRQGERTRIRILHYGDSQIENDRMTALIRFRLQQHFGGYGCGLVPAVPLYSGNPAYTEEVSGDFRRYTAFGKKDSSLNHNSYGVLGCVTSIPHGEWEKLPVLDFHFRTSRLAGQFDRIKLFIHSYADSSSIQFRVNERDVDTLRNIEAGYSLISYQPDTVVSRLSLAFDFLEGGRIYGLSFESEGGLQVDNIAMRGSSGLIFSRMDREVFEEMYDHLRVGLMILQFGGNIVPYIKDPDFYYRRFKRELTYLKEVCQGVPIVVIGPSDMASREKGYFVTHPSLEGVRDALRRATLESGFIFWDMYEAMGGRNSIASFVHSDPPLARPDYVHFSIRGANLLAEMFYNALMLEFREFKEHTDRTSFEDKEERIDQTIVQAPSLLQI